jgi:hypothetical protein
MIVQAAQRRAAEEAANAAAMPGRLAWVIERFAAMPNPIIFATIDELPEILQEPVRRHVETGNGIDGIRSAIAEHRLTPKQREARDDRVAAALAEWRGERTLPSAEEQRRAFFATQNRMVNGDLVRGLLEDD